MQKVGDTYKILFDIGDHVLIDGDTSLIATITLIQVRLGSVMYECGYVHNGICYAPLIDEYRLRKIGNG